MYAQLGSFVFQNLFAPTEYGRNSQAVYAMHPLIDGKPRSQKTGDDLDEISLSVRLHMNFCKPKEQLDAMRQAKENGDVLTFIYGNGDVVGEFYITQIQDFIEFADPQGNMLSLLVNISLKEYVVDDKLQQQQEARIKSADSVGNKKPVVKRKANASTCASAVTGLVSTIENHAAAIDKMVTVGGGMFIPANRYTILQHLSDSKAAAQDIVTRCDDPASCASGKPDLKYRAQQVLNAEVSFTNVVRNSQHGQLSAQNQIFKVCARNLKAAAQPLVNVSMLRQNA